MIRAALLALLLALPAFAAEDFSQRDTCYWLVGVFTDGTVDSAELDRCDSEGAQKGSNDLAWGVDVTAEEEAPPGSPAGADSTHHINSPNSAGAIAADEFASADFTYGGWWLFDDSAELYWIGRYGSGNPPAGQWHTSRKINTDTRWKTNNVFSSDSGIPIPNDTWTFYAISHDAGTGSGTMRTYSSESAIANTLFDCTGGTQDCYIEASPMSGDFDFNPTGNVAGSKVLLGNHYEGWFLAELLTPEEHCQICRCGFEKDVRGVGRIDVCGSQRCDVPAYEGCRRVID